MPGPRCECSPVNKPCSLALPPFWLACLIVSIGRCTLSPAPPPPPFCLSEVGKPSWVSIWFLGTDTFHGWRRYKSLKRDPALGRHSINTDNTTPSMLLTLSFLNNLFLVFSSSSFSPLLFFPFSFSLGSFFPNKKCKKSPLSSSKECSFYHCVLSLAYTHFYLTIVNVF